MGVPLKKTILKTDNNLHWNIISNKNMYCENTNLKTNKNNGDNTKTIS